MPIRPENKKRYPANWQAIRAAILKREDHRCKFCEVPNHIHIRRTTQEANSWQVDPSGVRIILTVAHLDHHPENNHPDNLAALCQLCHNRYDVKHRVANRRQRQTGLIDELLH